MLSRDINKSAMNVRSSRDSVEVQLNQGLIPPITVNPTKMVLAPIRLDLMACFSD